MRTLEPVLNLFFRVFTLFLITRARTHATPLSIYCLLWLWQLWESLKHKLAIGEPAIRTGILNCTLAVVFHGWGSSNWSILCHFVVRWRKQFELHVVWKIHFESGWGNPQFCIKLRVLNQLLLFISNLRRIFSFNFCIVRIRIIFNLWHSERFFLVIAQSIFIAIWRDDSIFAGLPMKSHLTSIPIREYASFLNFQTVSCSEERWMRRSRISWSQLLLFEVFSSFFYGLFICSAKSEHKIWRLMLTCVSTTTFLFLKLLWRKFLVLWYPPTSLSFALSVFR